jgi:hypothetical protein
MAVNPGLGCSHVVFPDIGKAAPASLTRRRVAWIPSNRGMGTSMSTHGGRSRAGGRRGYPSTRS